MTGRKVSITGKLGKIILNTYLNILSAGADAGAVEDISTPIRRASHATLTEDSLFLKIKLYIKSPRSVVFEININPNKTITKLVEEIVDKLNELPQYKRITRPFWNKNLLKLINMGAQIWPPIAPMTTANTLKDMNIMDNQSLYFIKRLDSLDEASKKHAIWSRGQAVISARRAAQEAAALRVLIQRTQEDWGLSSDSDDDEETLVQDAASYQDQQLI